MSILADSVVRSGITSRLQALLQVYGRSSPRRSFGLPAKALLIEAGAGDLVGGVSGEPSRHRAVHDPPRTVPVESQQLGGLAKRGTAKGTCTAKASSISVKREPGPAHGGDNVTTLCSSRAQRGRQARITAGVSYWGFVGLLTLSATAKVHGMPRLV